MSTMGLPLQAHTNVRDVLAPLFSNGRSFASLIDELSRHFKLEPSKSYAAHGDDPAGVLEASSESQSTDSEAEGNMSDEADSRLVQARVSAQAHSTKAAAAATAAAATQGTLFPVVESPPSPPPLDPHAVAVTVGVPAPVQAQTPARKTRSRSRQQQQQQQQQKKKRQQAELSTASVDEAENGPSKAARDEEGKKKAAGAGGGGRGSGAGAGDRRRLGAGGGGSGGGRGGAAGAAAHVKGLVSGSDLTVLSVTANADGWSEAVGAALSTRARAGYVFAQEVDPDSPQSSEFVREVFLDERSGARKALELRMRLIPLSQKVLLCSAWVDSGEYLAAAARLVAQCQAEVFGIACVRFEQNRSTEGLVDRFNLFAKSMPKGSVPSLNMGMKSCIPASLTKGFHGYTYNRGGARPIGAATVASRTGSALEGSGAAGVLSGGGASSDPGQDRAKKRKRQGSVTNGGGADAAKSSRALSRNEGDAAADFSPAASAPAPAAAAAAVAAADTDAEPMDEDSMIPAADEISAGEGLAEPGDGGQPAQSERFGGGAMSESEKAAAATARGSGDGGGAGWRQLVGGAVFSEEEGDYAADSERSTDHESMHLYGGGGRESDEHDMSEREAFRRNQVRGGGGGTLGRRGRGRSSGGRMSSRPGRADGRASSPETGVDADTENSSGRSSALGGDAAGSGLSRASAMVMASPKRREIGTGIGAGGGPRAGALLDEVGEHSGSLAHSEASGSGGGEEESERHDGDGDGKDVMEETTSRGDDDDGGGGSGGIGAIAPLEWKAKLGRQPIFMSRGLSEEDPDLLPSHSEGGTGRLGSPGRSVTGGLSRTIPDPEDDRDRASSCSSADSPIRSGGIVRPGSRGSGGRAGGDRAAGGGDDGRNGKHHSRRPLATAGEARNLLAPAAVVGAPAASPPPTAASRLAAARPNSPGGAVPWHHTSVYEANNPTEDRHVELSHDALGVKIYCVCDGHGGSRAAQFVCDHLAANVLARVQSIATAAAQAQERGGGSESGAAGGARNGGNVGGVNDGGDGGGWIPDDEEIRRSLAVAFESCDEQFIAQLDPTKNKGYINAGCCVVLALLIRSKLYVAHVGDCRVVLGTTDAARFSTSAAPSTNPTSSGDGTAVAAAVTRKRGGGTGVSPGGGGSGSGGRGVRGATGTATSAGRVASPRRAGASIAAAAELNAVALSRDHNCDDADEAALVRARSGDDSAIRVSRNDEWKGARAIKRVAGSLAVTRAIGDAYLKKAAFSFSPYKEGVPYITAEPAVTAVELTPNDRFLVLATDGVWEQVSNEEAVRCVSGALGGSGSGRRPRSTASRTTAGGGGGVNGGGGGSSGRAGSSYTSDVLVDLVLARSAQSHGMSVPALRALPRGSSRRVLHDDVCATVVHFSPPVPRPPPL